MTSAPKTHGARARLARWLDGFTATLDQADEEGLRRARMLVSSSYVLLLFALPFMVWNWTAQGMSPSVIAFLIGCPLVALNPLLLRTSRLPRLVASLACLELIAALATMTYAHGGLESAAVWWHAVIPVLATMWAGPTLAIVVAAIVVGELSIFYALEQSGYVFPRPLSDDAMAMWRFAGATGVVGFMAVLLWVHEHITLQVLRRGAVQSNYRGRMLRAVLDSSMNAVISFSGTGTVKSWDGGAREMFGWGRNHAIGKKIYELIFPSHDESSRGGFMRRLREGETTRAISHRMEMELVDHSGRRFFAELSISPPIDFDGATLFTTYVRDLSKEKRTQARVRELRRDLLHVIEENPDGMAVYGESGLMFANRSWGRWFDPGETDRELIELVVTQERGELDEALMSAQAGASPSHLGEFTFISVTAETVVLDLHAVPGIHFEGTDAMLIVGRDVTIQQKMRSRLAISDRMAAMGTLLAGVAHEINNPLTYVMGNLSLVELEFDRLDVDQRVRQAVSDANDGADRICEIVRDLQKLSRDESGPARPIELNGAVRSALKVAQNKTKYAAAVVDELGEVPLAMASEGRIAQVVLNLVINAVQSFTRPDTEVNIIRVSSHAALGKRVCVEIRDNGPGIAAEHLDRLFDPFFTTKPLGQGTGLGLAICHNIVNGFDGEIAVDSRLGVGTTFRFWLHEAGSPNAEKVPATLPEVRRSARVLVIDDEPRILANYSNVLHSHDVAVAQSGDDALAHISKTDDIDLILCDVSMPGMTGIELFHRIRELHPENIERFVFVTGSFDSETRSTVAELGAEMLEKPVDPAALRELAQRAAARGRDETSV